MKVAEIRIDGGTQPRSEIDEGLVADYAEAMQNGEKFPPVIVFRDGVNYWLADGFHRVHAARKAGLSEIEADCRDGTKREAVLFSVGANATHGLRRTNSDKRKAVMTLLNDAEWSAWSDREIARRCSVSNTFVSGLRPSLSTNDSEQEPERTYTTKHGTVATMKTENIGKKAESAEVVEMPKPKSKGVGIRLAHEAIAVLKRIPMNDGLKQDAYDMVIDWIETNRGVSGNDKKHG